MRTRTWLLLLCLLVGIVGFGDHPKAAGPTATFHVIGDIDRPGVNDGAMTVIKDATKVGGVIYAVGGAVTRQTTCGNPGQGLCPNTDTGILWRSDGNGTPQALPDIASPVQNPAVTASAITRDASYIASAARDVVPGTTNSILRAVRVTTDPLANDENLSAYFPALNVSAGAVAVSEPGATVLYGNASGRGVRFDTATDTRADIPLLCTSIAGACTHAHTSNPVADRGSSADGNVAVGTSLFFTPQTGPLNNKAYRYVHGEGITAIPLLDGGPFRINVAVAVSPDGDLVLVAGDSEAYPNGEPYFYRASTNQRTPLGVPNGSPSAPWRPGGQLCANNVCNAPSGMNIGGMTSDGSVVAMNFVSLPGVGGSFAYFRNTHGWFHLGSALDANDVDIAADGWRNLFIQGISPDGTLVYGAGEHNGTVKGFVAEFAPGALASFDPPAVPPADPSIVGAWTDDLNNPSLILVFTADGAYFHLEDVVGRSGPVQGVNLGIGFERGLYTFDGSALTVTTLVDTNGDIGGSGEYGSFPFTVTGDIATLGSGGDVGQAYRIKGGAGSILGAWVQGNPTQRNNSFLAVFLTTHIFQATDDPEFGGIGAERGTYTFAPEITCAPFTHEINIFPNGGGSPDLHNCGTLASNERTIDALGDDGDEFHVTRVIDPRTPLITSALDAVATVGLPFAYQITATNSPATFGAFGLPSWLAFDPDTGRLSGTPPATTTVPLDIRVEASNPLSTTTGRDHLSLVVIAPAIVSEGPTTVTPIAPEEPGETPPITIEFENVTSGGTISVATIDPEIVESAPEPPAGFSLGDDPVYFEIVPSAELTFTGPVTVCFSYEGITFSGFPRLLHYDDELMTWVDITTSVDTDNEIICGLTASFSPFVIAAAALDAKGFHPPIKPLAGALNTVKGGSTVALKFNVFGEGNVEITNPDDIDNLKFEVSPVVCDGVGNTDWEVGTTTGNAGLRYDTSSGQFVQNWKTPTLPGCYLVRVQGDGLLLSALFKVR